METYNDWLAHAFPHNQYSGVLIHRAILLPFQSYVMHADFAALVWGGQDTAMSPRSLKKASSGQQKRSSSTGPQQRQTSNKENQREMARSAQAALAGLPAMWQSSAAGETQNTMLLCGALKDMATTFAGSLHAAPPPSSASQRERELEEKNAQLEAMLASYRCGQVPAGTAAGQGLAGMGRDSSADASFGTGMPRAQRYEVPGKNRGMGARDAASVQLSRDNVSMHASGPDISRGAFGQQAFMGGGDHVPRHGTSLPNANATRPVHQPKPANDKHSSPEPPPYSPC